jgi:selenide,water dikinase
MIDQAIQNKKPTCYGCAGKLNKRSLAEVFGRLPNVKDDRLIVGSGTFDDASVFQLDPSLGLVSTVDIMDPIGEDYYRFGRVAAANSLSDIYAMGGEPLVVLNVVSTPASDEALENLAQVMKGAQEVIVEAGAALGGGHTTVSEHLKFGLAVTGRIQPKMAVTNAGAQPGDQLMLTKPLGATSLLNGLLQNDPSHPLVDRAFEVMAQLNREAAAAMLAVGVNACTDVTGFGFLGHLSEMMEASQTTAYIQATELPLLDSALNFANLPSRAREHNRDSVGSAIQIGEFVEPALVDLMYEAITSGGLLISVPANKVSHLRSQLEILDVCAACVGEVVAPELNLRVIVRS